ncbi:Fructose-bisphosphate aldolase 1 [Meyerozyma guilliermondii]
MRLYVVHGMLDADEEFFKKTGEPLFSSHMLDLSEESDEENIGGEEDGVNNERAKGIVVHFARNRIQGLRALSPIGPNFSIAAAFGNVHGVYKPGNVQLKPEIVGEHQKCAKEQAIVFGFPWWIRFVATGIRHRHHPRCGQGQLGH